MLGGSTVGTGTTGTALTSSMGSSTAGSSFTLLEYVDGAPEAAARPFFLPDLEPNLDLRLLDRSDRVCFSSTRVTFATHVVLTGALSGSPIP